MYVDVWTELESTFGTRPTGEVVEVRWIGPRCQTVRYPAELRKYSVAVLARPGLEGFADPYLRYEANGVALGTWFRVADWTTRAVYPGSDVTLTTVVRRPTSYGQSVTETRTTPTHWAVGDDHVLYVQPRHWVDVGGEFSIVVRVLACEGRGEDAAAVDASQSVPVTTAAIVLPGRVANDQAACLYRFFEEHRFEWPPPLEQPGWTPPREFSDLMRRRDFAAGGAPLLRLLEQAENGSVTAARRLQEAATLLDVHVDALREVGRRLAATSSAGRGKDE